MCGIVGYSGSKSAETVLLVGLKKLEYRGYDSAGLAIMDGGELVIQKTQGKIEALEKLLQSKNVRGQTGIGHTRWATHGEPSRLNSHPHTNRDGSISVVHNGIIENYGALKKELQSEGFIFASFTDTEVIPHLIDKYMKDGFELKVAFYKALQRLEGKYAIAMISDREPDKVFFARNGNPLLIGRDPARNEFLLSSDIPALVPIAKEYMPLADEQWGFFTKESLELYDWDGEVVEPEFHEMELTEKDVEKGDYEHYMLKEIYEQPAMIQKIIRERIDERGHILFHEMKMSRESLAKINRISIQACGTSLNAGMIGKLYFEQFSRIFTDADYSSEFRYRNPVMNVDTLVIGISQSGETGDTLAGLHEAKASFLPVISFLNNLHSTMARESDAIVDLMAGPEIGVASTKAYTAEVFNLFLFSIFLSSIKWILPKEEREKIIQEVHELPEKMETVLKNVEPIKEIAQFLKDSKDTIFLGRTFNYPSALEGALKLKEISYIHASGYAGGEFKHGPIALVSEQVPVIVIVPQGAIHQKMLSNLEEVKARKGKIISVITEGDEEIKALSDFSLEIPPVIEPLSPILTALPLQLLAYYTALYRGCDVDQPRNLAKSVTVE